MPITFTKLEPYVYYSEWVGHIQTSDMHMFVEQLTSSYRESGESAKVVINILDTRKMTNLPMDYNLIKGTAMGRTTDFALIYIGAPTVWEMMARSMKLLFKLPMEFCKDTDCAHKKAQEILKYYNT
ncbi:MAG: hypothetical protein ACOYLB_02290 [Phototrophicaceae bacterium]|jgi:hypothetical protein